jgi:quercetin dioxygenase-like cupin family protein
MPAELFPRRAELSDQPSYCFDIIAAPPEGWPDLAMGEWELRGDEVGDQHPHVEVTYVLEGRLVVDCDGERLAAGPGDVVRVPRGRAAYYSAPDYARMLFIYGPNPDGAPSQDLPPRPQ